MKKRSPQKLLKNDTHKQCGDCHEMKLHSEFRIENGKVYSYCKICLSKRYKDLYDKKKKTKEYKRKINEYRQTKNYKALRSYRNKANRAEITRKHKEWRNKNREAFKKQRRQYFESNLNARIGASIRSRIRMAFKSQGLRKSNATIDLLGCSIECLLFRLELLFVDGMNWKSFHDGKIHIGHIFPCCYFDLSKEEEQRKCFHWSNLRPEWAKQNLSKAGLDKKIKFGEPFSLDQLKIRNILGKIYEDTNREYLFKLSNISGKIE